MHSMGQKSLVACDLSSHPGQVLKLLILTDYLYVIWHLYSVGLAAQSCLTLCDPMDRSTPGFPLHHQLPEATETQVHRVGDNIYANKYLHL